jgi:soluble lytic murein transglycosylase
MKFKYLILILPLLLVGSLYYLCPLKYQNEVQDASDKFKVDKKLIFAIIKIESNFEKDAISSKGAIGLMQVMPSTADWIIKKNDKLPEEYDLFNPAQNIEVGVMYLRYLLDKYDGDVQKALIAYNAGPTRLKDGSWENIEETKNYLRKYSIVSRGYSMVFLIRRVL